jgi:hypothetical protein
MFSYMRTLIMPQSEVIFYREGETVFVREWLKGLPNKVQRKCLIFIARVEMEGHELRRPIADFLRDGIDELRPSCQGVPYRILYFFSGRDVVVLSQGVTKESEVPDVEINRAVERKKKFEADPKAHTYKPGR